MTCYVLAHQPLSTSTNVENKSWQDMQHATCNMHNQNEIKRKRNFTKQKEKFRLTIFTATISDVCISAAEKTKFSLKKQKSAHQVMNQKTEK